MSEHILKAIEYVERNAARAHERLERERARDEELLTTGGEVGTTSTLATVDAAIAEIERIARLAETARRDYAATYGKREDNGEAVA